MTTRAAYPLLDWRLDGASLIEASAGTGKTWNICGLYLRLLLEQKLNVPNILVVTFTHAATAELRDRIRRRLVEARQHLAGETLPDTDGFIVALFDSLRNKGKFDHSAMLHRLDLSLQTFDEAAIHTIHGFCQRALSDAPFTTGQAFTRELMPDDSALLMEVVQDFWRQHVAHAAIGNELSACLLQHGDTPASFASLLRRHLAKPLARVRWPEADAPEIDGHALRHAHAAAGNCWKAHRDDVLSLLNAALEKHLDGRRYNAARILQAAADCDAYFKTSAPLSGNVDPNALRLLRATTLVTGIGVKSKGTPPRHEFFDLLENALSTRARLEQALTLHRLQLIRNMLESCSAEMRKRKREQRLFSFDDILFNLHQALGDDPDSPLAITLRERYPAALVDEFQDTDPQQLAIFGTIYGRGKQPLFMVGDPKQAIYSFRNADLHTYLSARKQTATIHTITGNQRSTPHLIDALNALFSANPRAFVLDGLTYPPAGIGDKARQTFVEQGGNDAAMQIWTLPKDGEGMPILRAHAMRVATESVADEIARLLNDGADGSITIGSQPLRSGDIAVLVRSHAQGSRMRDALTRRNIGCVELSQSSVFHSVDAEEIERLLAAICFPSRSGLVRAALATEMLGMDAIAIDKLSRDEIAFSEWIQRFAAYREIWLRHGIGHAYRLLLAAEGISQRMLQRQDGERRVTNLLHLGELMHQAAQEHVSPESLLRWLQGQRNEGHAEEAQLRLESDRNLVRIVTIHKSKGLQFPIVFCPFLWDGHPTNTGSPEGVEYHDEASTVIDFRPDAIDDASIVRSIALEKAAEDMRLIYVALTRAEYRCYLISGTYAVPTRSAPSTAQSQRSRLNWLVAGKDVAPETWLDAGNKLATPESIADCWHALSQRAPGAITLSPLPPPRNESLRMSRQPDDKLQLQTLPTRHYSTWHIGSYSGLMRGATHENAAQDYDVQTTDAQGTIFELPAERKSDDILGFPRGADAGECIHKALELSDFQDPASWEAAIATALLQHPQPHADRLPLAAMLRRMLNDVCSTTLPDGIMLRNISPRKRLNEFGFHLPAAKLSADKLNQILLTSGYPSPRLSDREWQGFMKGFIDMVFEHDGRFYLLDWKSNHLGERAQDYNRNQVLLAMQTGGYHLQRLLYTLALDRYLALRLPGYRYETHFGGTLYLFIRGVRPDWHETNGEMPGVFFEKPEEAIIRQLGEYFLRSAA